MTTTNVHVPAADFPVLDRPYTAAEFTALPCVGRNGKITRVVSLPLEGLLEAGFDRASKMLCEAVVSELGVEWLLHSYIALGPATTFGHLGAETLSGSETWVHPRVVEPVAQAEVTEPQNPATMFLVCMSPGLPADQDDPCLCDAILPCPVHDLGR